MAVGEFEIGLPDKLERRRTDAGMEIVRRWFGFHILFLTAFACMWDAFLVYWYSIALTKGDLGEILFPLVHVAAGVGITYYVACGWVNRTHVVFNPQRITIRHKPLPWLGNREINAQNLKQLYSKVTYANNGRSVHYSVHALTKDGRNVEILGGLDNGEQALYIEQEIENYLGIKDAPVRGEIGR